MQYFNCCIFLHHYFVRVATVAAGGRKSPKVASLDPTTVLWDTSQPCPAVQQWDAQRAAVVTCCSTSPSPSLFLSFLGWVCVLELAVAGRLAISAISPNLD